MLKNKTVLEVKSGENSYELHCGPQSPLGDLHDALCKMKAFVVEKILAAQEAEKPKESENG